MFAIKWIRSYRELGRDAKLVILSELIFGVGNGVCLTIWQLYLKAAGYSGTVTSSPDLSRELPAFPSG